MLKADIRKLYKQKRKAISDPDKDKLEDLLLIQFQRSGIYVPQNILTYSFSPALDEIDPNLIMRYCSFINPEVIFHFPVINGLDMQVMATDDDTQFRINEFHIDEPVNGRITDTTQIDLVIVPLLAFDGRGNRVGFGKGYYDRFLKKCRPDCITAGLSYFEPLQIIEDLDEYDVPLDHVLTPHQCYSFT